MKKKQGEVKLSDMKINKAEYYCFQFAVIVLIVICLAATVFADDVRNISKDDSFIQALLLIGTGILGYIAWTIRRFIRKVDNIQSFLSSAVKVLITIATEHKSNHDSCVNFDELMKSDEI